jgi:hypothetical protein
MTWKAYGASRPLPAGASVRYLRSKESPEGGHLVVFPDGQAVRVLPDGESTAQSRLRTITLALDELASGHLDPVAYFQAPLGGRIEQADGTEEAS